jgi:hypothetical protein
MQGGVFVSKSLRGCDGPSTWCDSKRGRELGEPCGAMSSFVLGEMNVEEDHADAWDSPAAAAVATDAVVWAIALRFMVVASMYARVWCVARSGLV